MDALSREAALEVRFAVRALVLAAILITCSCGGGSNDGYTGGTGSPPSTIAAPAISYAQTSYALTTGVPLAEVMPVNTGGAATAWSVTPSLPAGLTLSASDGSIRGNPTAVVGPTTHVVRAENSAGAGTANLTFSVESGVLLDLGHTVSIELLRYTGSRILSVQIEASDDRHWVLWDSQTGENLAQGDSVCPACKPLADLAGPIFVVRLPTVSSCARRRTAASWRHIDTKPSWWKLAADGSYFAAGAAAV